MYIVYNVDNVHKDNKNGYKISIRNTLFHRDKTGLLSLYIIMYPYINNISILCTLRTLYSLYTLYTMRTMNTTEKNRFEIQ